MTNKEFYDLFSAAIKKKKIVRCENSTSRDDYSVYAIRETLEGYLFFCLVETFFRSGQNTDKWNEGSLSSYHEFNIIKGAAAGSLQLTNENFIPAIDYKNKLPVLGQAELKWETID